MARHSSEVSSAMWNRAQRVLTPVASRKRKERDSPDAQNASAPEPAPPNRLLAGYLAHEFLTKGTLLGQRWDPSRAEPQPTPDSMKPDCTPLLPADEASAPKKPLAYADVAYLLKTDGAHIPGIVNPTQLARWLHM